MPVRGHCLPTERAPGGRAQSGYRKFKRTFVSVCRVGAGRTSAGLDPTWVRIRAPARRSASDFGFVGLRSGAMRDHFTPVSCSGPSAALRVVAASCRLPILALGGVAGGASSGHSRRCPRWWPVVRLLERAVFLEVDDDGADGLRLFDAGDDLHLRRRSRRTVSTSMPKTRLRRCAQVIDRRRFSSGVRWSGDRVSRSLRLCRDARA
jgi:hypothetical protein